MGKYIYITNCHKDGQDVTKEYKSLREQEEDFEPFVRQMFNEDEYSHGNLSQTLERFQKALRQKNCSKVKYYHAYGFYAEDDKEIKLTRLGNK